MDQESRVVVLEEDLGQFQPPTWHLVTVHNSTASGSYTPFELHEQQAYNEVYIHTYR